jgi:hypothetical protein
LGIIGRLAVSTGGEHGLGAGGGVILSAGFPVMVYSTILGDIPAVLFFCSRWGVVLAAVGIPCGLWLMVKNGYPNDVVAVVVAVTVVDLQIECNQGLTLK